MFAATPRSTDEARGGCVENIAWLFHHLSHTGNTREHNACTLAHNALKKKNDFGGVVTNFANSTSIVFDTGEPSMVSRTAALAARLPVLPTADPTYQERVDLAMGDYAGLTALQLVAAYVDLRREKDAIEEAV